MPNNYQCEPVVCPGCGGSFTCGLDAGWQRCWCADLPPMKAPPAPGKGCYCSECLKKMLAAAPLKPA